MGAETVGFIRLWIELPFGMVFVLLYTKLCNIMSTEKIFRYIILSCLAFFTFFTFVIFPNLDYFHPSQEKVLYYSKILPPHFHWFIVIWSKWCLAIFYVIADLWPAVVYTLLFWQLANKITLLKESISFYPILSFIGQSNLLIAGPLIIYFSSDHHFLLSLFSSITNKAEVTLKSFTVLVLISGIIATIIQRYIEKNVLYSYIPNKNTHLSLSVKDSMRTILSSKYLLKICLLLICYNISVILIDGLWMNQARKIYTLPQELISYQGKVFFFTGLFSILCALSGTLILRKYGWLKTALAIPIIFAVIGSIFFISVIINKTDPHALEFITAPLTIIIIIGAAANIFGKGAKYALFDSTKEMAYIPLDAELKTKGKAVVDILGIKIGRLSGSGLEFLFLMSAPGSGYDQVAHLLFFAFIIVNIIWISSLVSLSKDYNILARKQP